MPAQERISQETERGEKIPELVDPLRRRKNHTTQKSKYTGFFAGTNLV